MSTEQQYAWTHLEGEKAPMGRALVYGDTIYSSDGEPWSFERVSRPAQGNSIGRVSVSRTCPDTDEHGECSHSWHRDDREVMDYFPSVFGLYLGDENGEQI